ncbi:hypothetical protein JW872_01785 [Candidatus Babeliales bacterium]|nr:hypothetical protein [Candidatus Babeliales bacterium]
MKRRIVLLLFCVFTSYQATAQECSYSTYLVPALYNCFGVAILEEEVFLRTAGLNHRSLLDYPTLSAHPPHNNDWLAQIHLFWNQTPHSCFTKQSKSIDSVLALQDPGLVTAVQEFLTAVRTKPCGDILLASPGKDSDVFYMDVNHVFGLFSEATVEQRRIGFLAELAKNIYGWTIDLKLPVYYQERNYQLDLEKQEEIKQTALKFFPTSSQAADDQFTANYLISDRLGIGDTRLAIGYNLLTTKRLHMLFGGEATIPTAFSVQKGVYGSTFELDAGCPDRPTIDLCEIFELNLTAVELKDELARNITLIGRRVLERLSEMLLEKPLGDHGHTGLGIFLEPTFTLSDTTKWYNRLAFEHIFPASEIRFILEPANLAAFAQRDFSSTDSATAASNLRFLNARLLDMFFPDRVHVRVQPKILFKVTSVFAYEPENLGFNFGVDFWGHQAETITWDREPELLQTHDLTIARRTGAFQFKVLGSFFGKLDIDDTPWKLQLSADITPLSSGIGKDFTLSLNAQTEW